MFSMSNLCFGIGILLLLLCFSTKISNFLDIRKMFIQHFDIFKGNWIQFIGIFVSPFFLSIAIVGVKCVDAAIINNLNIVLSILIAMFFSVLSILCTFFDGKSKTVKYKNLMKETFNSTIFEIIICLFILLVSFITLFRNDFTDNNMLKIVSGIIYYFSIVAVLNILVIIKRVKALFDHFI